MVNNRCAGLPLAIVVLAGILTNYSSQEWKKVSQHVESYMYKDEHQSINDVLALSYAELPSYLRPCFLYLSHFPEDFEIDVDRLIQLWVAEGFISLENGEESLEDVADGYLVELVVRFMVQVGERDVNFKIKTCRMHDLMRDLCLKKAKQENFLHIMDDSSYNKLSLCRARRIVANEWPRKGINGSNKANNVRSIMLFNSWFDSSWKSIFKIFELIRVLDIERMSVQFGSLPSWEKGVRRYSYVTKLPSDIGKLIHLRFLSFRDLKLRYGCLVLPSSIGNLTSLQTLDLRIPCCIYAPNELWRLEQLKHLYLPTWEEKSSYAGDIGSRSYKQKKLALHTLTKLQTLVNFNEKVCHSTGLPNLTSLRKLGFYKAKKLPEPKDFPSDVVEITLVRCKLRKDPMPTLEKLPNLRVLTIQSINYLGKEMVCSPLGFPKLHSLTLNWFDSGTMFHSLEWKVDEGAMPALHCPWLKKLPEELRSITTLQEVKINRMPKEFIDEVVAKLKKVPFHIFITDDQLKHTEELINEIMLPYQQID